MATVNTFKFGMRRTNGSVIQLVDVLSAFIDNNWTWSILEFDGVGIAPLNMSIDGFHDLTVSLPAGFLMKWDDLKRFASNLEQTWQFVAIAVESLDDLDPDNLAADNFEDCIAVIEAFDSKEWTVSVRDLALLRHPSIFSPAP